MKMAGGGGRLFQQVNGLTIYEYNRVGMQLGSCNGGKKKERFLLYLLYFRTS